MYRFYTWPTVVFAILNLSSSFITEKTLIIDSIAKYQDFIRAKETGYTSIIIEGALINQQYGVYFGNDSVYFRLNQNQGLQALAIHSCHLNVIDNRLCNNLKLKKLDLGDNEIEVFNEKILMLKDLEEVILIYNKLTNLSCLDRVANKNQRKIKQFDFSNNRIDKIPESISHFSSLKYLYIHDNKIKVIPGSITRLRKLLQLDLSNNLIEDLPCSLSKKNGQFELNISGNYIKELPCCYSKVQNPNYNLIIGLKTLPDCFKSANNKGIQIQ